MREHVISENGIPQPITQAVERISIRPDEFTAPKDDPFKHDLLDRKPAIESLTRIVGSARSPYVISVDAEWGSGKTAFLEMWCRHLENEGYTVVNFNAWETDFADSPFQALSAEITHQLDGGSDSLVDEGIKNVREMATNAAVALTKSALRGVGTMLPGAGPITAEVVIKAIEAMLKEPPQDPISEYETVRNSLGEFTASIAKVAEAVSDSTEGKPLVVAIDELDRCRPTYAIELLEIAKHIFLVKNVVFILAINSSALGHSVKSLYGAGFDAERYFRRFFDLQFRLPEADRVSFADALLTSTNLQRRIKSQSGDTLAPMTFAKHLLMSNGLSLRDAEQAAHRMGLILHMLGDPDPWTDLCALIGLSIMFFEPAEYAKFLRGHTTDEVAFEILTRNLSFEASDLMYVKPEIQGAVMALAQCRTASRRTESQSLTSTLIAKHRATVESVDQGQNGRNRDQEEAMQTLGWFERIWDFLHVRGRGSTLIDSLRSLELVFPVRSSDSDQIRS